MDYVKAQKMPQRTDQWLGHFVVHQLSPTKRYSPLAIVKAAAHYKEYYNRIRGRHGLTNFEKVISHTITMCG
jgi:hypothetical protein